MPIFHEKNRTMLRRNGIHGMHGLFQHSCFNLAALAVQPVELLRAVRGARLVVGDQAFDAQAHVGEAPGRAAMPGWPFPARSRFRPCATRLRLLASSGTTSATVPRATKSVSDPRLGSFFSWKKSLFLSSE